MKKIYLLFITFCSLFLLGCTEIQKPYNDFDFLQQNLGSGFANISKENQIKILYSGIDEGNLLNGYFTNGKNVFFYKIYSGSSDKDSNNFIILSGIDHKTFQVVAPGFVRDSKTVGYTYGSEFETVDGLDIDSFKFITGNLLKDKNHVFLGNYILSNEPDTFEILGANIVKDKNNVWSDYGIGETSVDPKTAKFLCGPYKCGSALCEDFSFVVDKNAIRSLPLRYDSISGFDYDTIKCQYGNFIDKNKVYYCDGYGGDCRKLPNIDHKTISWINHDIWQDKNGIFVVYISSDGKLVFKNLNNYIKHPESFNCYEKSTENEENSDGYTICKDSEFIYKYIIDSHFENGKDTYTFDFKQIGNVNK